MNHSALQDFIVWLVISCLLSLSMIGVVIYLKKSQKKSIAFIMGITLWLLFALDALLSTVIISPDFYLYFTVHLVLGIFAIIWSMVELYKKRVKKFSVIGLALTVCYLLTMIVFFILAMAF